MKKRLSALLCLLLLTGCTNFNANLSANVPSGAEGSASAVSSAASGEGSGQSAAASGDAAGQDAAVQPQENKDAYLTAQASDAFDGPVQFVAEEAGSYRFVSAQSGEGMSWDFYVLDQEFEEDALRYLPQANESAATLEGDGEAELVLKADQLVYCFCSVNSLTADEPAAAGTLSVFFTPAAQPEQGEVRAQESGLDLDAADLWSEGVYSFQARQDAVYNVTREGEDDWNVYVLDQEFEDAVRYLPQANESVVTNEGSFEVKAGQFVYCLSDLNSFTADDAPERGASVLHLTLQ